MGHGGPALVLGEAQVHKTCKRERKAYIISPKENHAIGIEGRRHATSRKEKTLQSHRREDVRTIGRPSNIVQTMTLLRAHVYERIKVMLPKEVLKWWKHFTAVPVLASG